MKVIFNTLKTIVIFGAICIGASYAYAQVGSGMPLPIHTGFDQIKNGSLAVDGFVSHGIASFDGSPTSVWFSGIIRGDSPLKKELASIVRIGGTDAITGTTYNTVVQATDEIRAAQRLYAQNIKNTYDGALCADAEGYVVLCDTPVLPVPETSPGTISVAMSCDTYFYEDNPQETGRDPGYTNVQFYFSNPVNAPIEISYCGDTNCYEPSRYDKIIMPAGQKIVGYDTTGGSPQSCTIKSISPASLSGYTFSY